MKRTLLTLAIVLLAVAAQAQNTAIKVHSDGQISLQSATTSYGIQIPASGVMSIEPNITIWKNIHNPNAQPTCQGMVCETWWRNRSSCFKYFLCLRKW